jgi:NADPH:quinone reductase
MQAIHIKSPGPDALLQLGDMPMPEPQPDEILIRVSHAGVNRADLMQRAGKYPPPPDASPVLGLEVSGTVQKTGQKVTEWKPGDAVCALLEGGGYAEYATVKATQVLPVPAGWTMEEAAALPEALYTTWQNLVQLGNLQPGETLLVHGGASGIGTTAIQLVGLLGAKAFATAVSDEKCSLCEKLGAKAINYKQKDIETAIKALSPDGVDIILDYVGADYFDLNLRLLKPHGRLISLAFLSGAKGEINAAPILFKQLHWFGSTLRGRSASHKAVLTQEIRSRAWPWLETRQLVPVLDAVFPLKDAEKAHQRMQQNLNLGKIVLKVAP